MSDNNSKSLIEDTVKLLKLESKELNEISVPGLPMSYGSARINSGWASHFQDLEKRRKLSGVRGSSKVKSREMSQKRAAQQGEVSHSGHTAHERGQGGKLNPKHWAKAGIDQFDQEGNYQKSETNESFAQYYTKATHHPRTPDGTPVQDDWNNQLRCRSGMNGPIATKSYTEPYWNKNNTPKTEQEFIINMHNVNGVLDGEDYIKSTFTNINNSVPFKSPTRHNDASPSQDAKTILPQVHSDNSPEESMRKMRTAYEQVIHGDAQQIDEVFWGKDPSITTSPKPGERVTFTGKRSFWSGKKKFKRDSPVGSDVYNQAKSMVSPEHVDKYVQDHQNNIDYSETAKNTVNKNLNAHISDMKEIATAHDAITKTSSFNPIGGVDSVKGGKSKSNIDNIVRQAKKGRYIRPNKFSMPKEYKGIAGDSLRKHVGKLVDHIEYANEANAQHDRNIEANSDAISHLTKKTKDKNWHIQYINDHQGNATHQHLKAQLLDKDFDIHHKSANELRDTLGKGLGLSQQKTSLKLPRMSGSDSGVDNTDFTKRTHDKVRNTVGDIHPKAQEFLPAGKTSRDNAVESEIAIQKKHVELNPGRLLARSQAEVDMLQHVSNNPNANQDEHDSATAALKQAKFHHKKATEAMNNGDVKGAVKSFGDVLHHSSEFHMSKHGDSPAANEAAAAIGRRSTLRENLGHWSNDNHPDNKTGLIASEGKSGEGWALAGGALLAAAG